MFQQQCFSSQSMQHCCPAGKSDTVIHTFGNQTCKILNFISITKFGVSLKKKCTDDELKILSNTSNLLSKNLGNWNMELLWLQSTNGNVDCWLACEWRAIILRLNFKNYLNVIQHHMRLFLMSVSSSF